MKNFPASLGAAFAFAALSITSASAAPITGTLNMFGEFLPIIGDGIIYTQNLGLADVIDFLPRSTPDGSGTGTFATGAGTGTLATFANQTGGVIRDFDFLHFPTGETQFDGQLLYTIRVGGVLLVGELSSVTVINQNANALTLSGIGPLHLAGFDATLASWHFSGQSSNGSAPDATFSWSATVSAERVPVPEPFTLGLVGLGLLAIAYRRRQSVGCQVGAPA